MATENERGFVQAVNNLIGLYDHMETIGSTDLGWISHRMAGRYHTMTRNMAALITELTQDAAWPHEPWKPGDEPAEIA